MEGALDASRSTQSKEPSRKKSWSDFSDDDVYETIVQAAENNNTNGLAMAIDELTDRKARRIAQEVAQQVVGDSRAQMSLEELERQVSAETYHRLGAETSNVESDLFRSASDYYGALKKRYGDDIVKKVPHLQQLAYLLAYSDLSAKDKEELRGLRAEMDRRQALESMERGLVGATNRNADVKAALSRSRDQGGPDIKGAIRALGLFRRG